MEFDDNVFIEAVSTHFSYLVEEFSYLTPNAYETVNGSFVDYINPKLGLLVRIEYSYRNKTIMCTLFNAIKNSKPISFRNEHKVTVPALLSQRGGNEMSRYMDYMPEVIGLIQSCAKVAELLHKLGSNILSGVRWISAQEIIDADKKNNGM